MADWLAHTEPRVRVPQGGRSSTLTWILVTIAVLGCSLVSCARRGPERPAERYPLLPKPDTSLQSVTGTLKANFIGIYEGESCLIELPDGTTMLVDTGSYALGSHALGIELTNILKNMGITRIDYFVITDICDGHHSSNLIPILNSFEIGTFYMTSWGRHPALDTVSGAIDILTEKGVPIVEASLGVAILNYQNLRASFLGPADSKRESSSVFALTYGDHTFFFADDGNSQAEKEIVEAEGTPDVTVLSVGNAHEYQEKCVALIEKCYPEIAVIYGDIPLKEIKKLQIELVEPNRMSLTAPPVVQQIVWTISTDGENLTSKKMHVKTTQ